MAETQAVLSLGLLPESQIEFQKLIAKVGEIDIPNILSWKLPECHTPLVRNSALDITLQTELRQNGELKKGKVPKLRKMLPVFKAKDAILNAVDTKSVFFITGEDGGENSQVPSLVLDHYIESGKGSLCRILCVQPRKIATISAAKRAAKDRGEDVGANCTIGYLTRYEKKLPRESGSILYCTSEIVKDLLSTDRQLSRYSHVILSHVHERDLETDFIVCVLKDLLKQRDDLKIILMGSENESSEFKNYFDGCKTIQVKSFFHPVIKYMLEDILEMTNYEPNRTDPRSDAAPHEFLAEIKGKKYSDDTIQKLRDWDEGFNPSLIRVLLGHICKDKTDGSILVILPGSYYVNRAYINLTEDRMFGKKHFLVIAVDDEFPVSLQKQIFNPPPKGVRRKIILSTDITESCINIEDVTYVIDCGKKECKPRERFRYVQHKLHWISRSSVQRRMMRAGITKPGKSYHLFTSHRESMMSPSQSPEILNTPVDHLCMTIKYLQFGDILQFLSRFVTPPLQQNFDYSIKLLKTIGCFDEQQNLTPLGFVLSQLPLNPRLGKMILYGAMFSCLAPTLVIAASLDYMEPFCYTPNEMDHMSTIKKKFSGGSRSDHIVLANAFQGWLKSTSKEEYCQRNCLSQITLSNLDRLRYEYTDILHRLRFIRSKDPEYELSNINSENQELLKAVICAGLCPNVSMVRSEGAKKFYYDKYSLKTAHTKSILAESSNFPEKWAVFYNLSRTEVYDLTLVRPMALFLFGLRGNEKVEDDETLIVDNWIHIKAPETPLKLLMDIRRVFFNIVDEIIYCRNPVDWQSKDVKVEFLRYIVERLGTRKSKAASRVS